MDANTEKELDTLVDTWADEWRKRTNTTKLHRRLDE
jgi:hypothetical protein